MTEWRIDGAARQGALGSGCFVLLFGIPGLVMGIVGGEVSMIISGVLLIGLGVSELAKGLRASVRFGGEQLDVCNGWTTRRIARQTITGVREHTTAFGATMVAVDISGGGEVRLRATLHPRNSAIGVTGQVAALRSWIHPASAQSTRRPRRTARGEA